MQNTLLRITGISVFWKHFQVNRNKRNCYLLGTDILCILSFLKGNKLFPNGYFKTRMDTLWCLHNVISFIVKALKSVCQLVRQRTQSIKFHLGRENPF